MERVKKALSLFHDGANCAQAILSTYGTEYGMDKETAMRLASSFGGGMGLQGMVCGAVTGAYMVISLKNGNSEISDTESRAKADAIVQEFTSKFKSRRDGKVNCSELLGYTNHSFLDFEFGKQEDMFSKICPKCVKDAAEILEEILQHQFIDLIELSV